jgi:YVTN family beta-propeller protein
MRQIGILATVVACLVLSSWPAEAQPFVFGAGVICHGSTTLVCSTRVQVANVATQQTAVLADVSGSASVVRLAPAGDRILLAIDSSLVILDAHRGTTIATVTLPSSNVDDIAIMPDSSRAYVSDSAHNSLTVIDLAARTVSGTIAVPGGPTQMKLSANGGALYVVENTGNAVARVATATGTVAATIAVGTAPARLDISPDGTRVYAADNSSSPSVSIIDTATDAVVQQIPAPPSGPVTGLVALSANRLILASLKVVGTGVAVFTVSAVDASSGTVLGTSSRSSLLGGPLARNASGSQVFAAAGVPDALWSVDVADASLSTVGSTGFRWMDVLNDPCAFVASATPVVFTSTSGGSGTLTIPAPSGCAWSVDTTSVNGLTLNGSSSGTGPATRSFTIAPSSTPSLGTIAVGVLPIAIETTIPLMNVDFASGQTRQEPFTIGGWAVDLNVATGDPLSFHPEGIDGVQVWAYDQLGTARFVGAAFYNVSRPDVAAVFGGRYQYSGFQISVVNLPSGAYTLVFYAHSQRSNTYSSVVGVNVSVVAMTPAVVIDTPSAGAAVGTPFSVAGWAVDPTGGNGGPNIDAVHVYAYPDGGGAPTFLGAAQTGMSRPDVGAYLGSNLASCGYRLDGARLAAGSYTLVVYAHSATRGVFTARTQRVVAAASRPLMNVETPAKAAAGSATPVAAIFTIAGWAIDQTATTGSGVDAVQAWAYPVGVAGSPVFAGTGTVVARADVAAYAGSQFLASGFVISTTLSSGTYDLAVFAHSTVTGTFNNVQVVRVVVP